MDTNDLEELKAMTEVAPEPEPDLHVLIEQRKQFAEDAATFRNKEAEFRRLAEEAEAQLKVVNAQLRKALGIEPQPVAQPPANVTVKTRPVDNSIVFEEGSAVGEMMAGQAFIAPDGKSTVVVTKEGLKAAAEVSKLGGIQL